MTLDLQKAKDYLRVTFDDEDDYIQDLIEVSRAYIEDGVSDYHNKIKSDKFKIKVEMVQRAIIQDLYDERYLRGQDLKTSYMIRALIHQLEYGDYDV